MKNLPILLLLFLCWGCAGKSDKHAITLTLTNYSSIKLGGLNVAVLNDIDRDTSARKWQNLFPVYRMPADTTLKDLQPVQPGRYKLVNNQVSFTPDTPFVKGKTYFMRYYDFAEGGSLLDIILHKNNLGGHPYTDLIFKP
jgi:hypothetical protein